MEAWWLIWKHNYLTHVCNQNEQCWQNIFLETPDRVSISTVGHTGPMIEGREYELQCDIQNVAPVHLLTVNWYKGQHIVAKTSFSDSTKTPVNQSTIFHITVSRAHDGAQYRCEAELQVSKKRPGAQSTSKVSSQVLGLSVHCTFFYCTYALRFLSLCPFRKAYSVYLRQPTGIQSRRGC